MRTWTAQITSKGRPEDVLGVLTDPAACGRWAPIDFDVEGLDGNRLVTGSRARVVGRIAGRRIAFDVDVLVADASSLTLLASEAGGSVSLDVHYELSPALTGSELTATVAVAESRGFTGRVIAQVADAMLAGGALRQAVSRIAREAEFGSLAAA
jgi:Polyketide cyclase / dehydrase and lipid transport